MTKKIIYLLTFFFSILIVCTIQINSKGGLTYIQDKFYNISFIFNYFDKIYTKPQKIWLHRANTIEKIRDKGNKYYGFELDVIFYDTDTFFENSHDKTSTPLKYPLESRLQELNKFKNKGLWLDLKNLNTKNKEILAKELITSIEKHLSTIDKRKIIVESPNWELLNIFHSKGFRTSYYFNRTSNDLIDKSNILEASKSGFIDFVSFDSSDYSFVSSLCNGKNFKMLTWIIDKKNWISAIHSSFHANIINDERVEVVLCQDRKYTINH